MQSTYWMRLVLACGFLGAAWLKILSGHDPAYSIGPSLFWTATALECLIAAGITTSRFRPWALCAVLVCLSGIVHALLTEGSCGCFGGALASDGARILVSGVAGLVASLILRHGH